MDDLISGIPSSAAGDDGVRSISNRRSVDSHGIKTPVTAADMLFTVPVIDGTEASRLIIPMTDMSVDEAASE
jgi:hypothetical protein